VTPIPVDVKPIPADEEDSGENADQPSGRDAPQGAGDEDAAEEAGASDDAEADGAQEDAPAAKASGADTSTVALTVVDAKTT
jgi:macrolide phosphotransferase